MARGRQRIAIGSIVGGLGLVAATAGVIKLAKVDRRSPDAPLQVTLAPAWVSIRGSF